MSTEKISFPRKDKPSISSGIRLKTLLLLGLIPSLMILLGLLYVIMSQQADIRQECQRMLLSSLPQLIEQQSTAVKLERLLLQGNIVANSLDSLARRKARMDAQALSSHDAFVAVPGAEGLLDTVHSQLQLMALARDEQHVLRTQLHETAARIETVQTQLLTAFMQVPKEQALAQLTNVSAAFLDLLNVLDISNVTRGEENVEVIINKISSLEAQARGGDLPDSMLKNYRFLEQQSYLFLQVYKEYFAAEKKVNDARQQFESAVENLSERVTMNAAQGMESMLQNSITLAMGVERITWQGLMLLCATLIAALFLVRNLVCVPVMWLIRTIDAIRTGGDVPAEPKFFVHELQFLAKALLQLNFYWSQVKAHSQQLDNGSQLPKGLSIKDGLTGLFNKRYFSVILHNMWAEACREGGSVALLLMDIDFFDKYNSALGSSRGDACLQQLAHAFKAKTLRPTDKVCRYGGEEFALLLHCSNEEGPLRVAARLHEGVRHLALEHPTSAVADVITLSIGVVVHTPREGDAAPMLMEWAEHALLAAKNGGRNCTYVCRLHCDAQGLWHETLEEVAHDNRTVA